MKRSTAIRLIVWPPLVVLVLLTGLIYAVEGLGFDPFFWSGTRIISGVPQITPTQAELDTWPSFTETVSGISFKYPPVLQDSLPIGVSPDIPQPTCQDIFADTFSQPKPHSHSYVFYSPPKNYPGPSPHAPSVDWMYATLPGEGDRIAVSLDCRPFERQNITSVKMYWWNPEEIELGGRKGYRQIFHYDHTCMYEHYILPAMGNNIVRLSFNACKDSREVVRPYKQAILSTVKFTK